MVYKDRQINRLLKIFFFVCRIILSETGLCHGFVIVYKYIAWDCGKKINKMIQRSCLSLKYIDLDYFIKYIIFHPNKLHICYSRIDFLKCVLETFHYF